MSYLHISQSAAGVDVAMHLPRWNCSRRSSYGRDPRLLPAAGSII